MNICFLCRSFTNRGGTENYFYYLTKSLARQGHFVHIVGSSPEVQWEFGLEKDHIKFHILNFKEIQFPGFWRLKKFLPLYTWQYTKAVAKFLRELVDTHQIDIIEVPDWGGDAYFYLPNRKVPVCVHLLGYPGFKEQFGKKTSMKIRERLFWEILREHILKADVVTSVSNAYTDFVSDIFKVTGKTIIRLPIAIDTQLFQPNLQISREKIVFFAGRLEETKGIEVLEKAITSVIQAVHDVKFYFAGRDMPFKGSDQTWSQHLIKRFGTDRIIYLGVLPTKVLVTWFQKSLLCVMPSLYEPGGMVALEAMACGCPVIASSVGGLQESIRHEQTGLLVPPDNAPELAAAILRLISKNDLRQHLSQNALDYVEKNFNMDLVSRETLKVYQAAIDRFQHHEKS
jgi:glycogen(starch) synthase